MSGPVSGGLHCRYRYRGAVIRYLNSAPRYRWLHGAQKSRAQ
jgi:hypothetical protein